MFEVPTTSVKTERGSGQCDCSRGSTTADGRSSSNSVMSGGTYYLSCSTCRWDSTESGLRFERQQDLQIATPHKCLSMRISLNIMSRLFVCSDPTHSDLVLGMDPRLIVMALEQLHPAYMHSALLDPSIRSMRIKPDKRAVAYEPLLKPSGQSIDPVAQINQIPYEKPALNKDFGTLMVLQFCKCEFPIATMDSGRSAVIQQLRPVRVQLRSKRTKRCLGCEHILVKPEIKAASIRFGIKMTARRRSHSMLPPNYKSTPHAIQVHLEHPEDPPSICLMHIHEPRFTLAAFSDSWELHEPSSYGASDSVSGAQSQLDGTVAPVDACAVAAKDDMPQGISDPGVAHNEDLGSDKVVDNEISFWVVVGVGSSGSTSIEKTMTSAQIQDGSSTENLMINPHQVFPLLTNRMS
ncbi:hypothetical protein BSLG_001697 [Batrachochytrium salamandrivorans]|nr:hypothetical protein BSLG_001697 [Batrachochytrium salamandrivorans]